VRSFKGIICGDISEFESRMPSHAVWSLWAMYSCVPEGPQTRKRLDIGISTVGGNATGVNDFTSELVAKRLGLLQEPPSSLIS
jgi:hypothetical protein